MRWPPQLIAASANVVQAAQKVDLKTLFAPVCEHYSVPLTNGKGSWDINSRRRMLQRFRVHHEAGRRVVLGYCGDHDPAGLLISGVIKSNLLDCTRVQDVDWDPEPVEVIRFGLDKPQIDALGLTWIDNLITSSGKNLADPEHPDHRKPYVQNYIKDFGERKVEANALAAKPEDARRIVEDFINRFVPSNWPQDHQERLEPRREEAKKAFAAVMAAKGGN